VTDGLADLHRHLDGSLRRSTLEMLAAAHGVQVPADLGFHAGMGLHQALAQFAVTLSVLQTADAVRRVSAESCEDAAAEGVTTLEIRFAPQLHRGAPVADIVDAAVEGAKGRAGIVLCGLYGESPDVLRGHVELAQTRRGVVGIDLAGGPSSGDAWHLSDYAPAFERAREIGLGRTVHAGEGRPPQEIRAAVTTLHAQRIGHGTTLLQDPEVVDLVLARAVTIEACPTSNVHTGAIDCVAAHPLPRWLALGVRVTVCTDNTLLSDIDLPTELARTAEIEGMDEARVAQLVRFGHEAAFG